MKFAVFTTLVIVALVAWTGGPVSADDGRSLSTVNGAVSAEPGQAYDKLSAVNGTVRVGRGASADTAKTVNGTVLLEDEAKVGTASTVNGSLKVGAGASVTRGASTVNGSVELARGARVGGDVSTVSGNIELVGAEVAGELRTRNGDIELTDGARVGGGIHVSKNNDSNWGWNGDDDPLKVRICGTCVVDGELRFDRAVELRVENGAKIGPVVGDRVIRK